MVFVRVRPMNKREKDLKEGEGWMVSNTVIQSGDITKSGGRRPEHYTFDHVFGMDSNNGQIFDQIGIPIVDAVLKGYNGIIFAYGQTSSGKTHTIHGYDLDPGLVPRCVTRIFETITATPDREFAINMSYMECYNEIINDLLEPKNANLKILEDKKAGVFVQNLSEAHVASEEMVQMLLEKGQSNRQVGRTDFNSVSSRSHTIFTIRIESQSTKPGDKTVLSAVLNMVDLAGSENLANTDATKTRKTETGHINKSLLVLGHVISMIAQGKGAGHIPFRDSKLTRMLKDSLNGNAVISICCNMSPSSGSMDITSSTLRFADRAKQIKNTASANKKAASSETMIAKYKEEIEELKAQLAGGGGGGGGDPASGANVDALKDQHEQEMLKMKAQLAQYQTLILRGGEEKDGGSVKAAPAAGRRTSLMHVTKGMGTLEHLRATNDFGAVKTDLLGVQQAHTDNKALSQEVTELQMKLADAEVERDVLNARLEEAGEDYEDKAEEVESLVIFIATVKEKLKAKDDELDEAKDAIWALECAMAEYDKEAAEEERLDAAAEGEAVDAPAEQKDYNAIPERTPPATLSLTISIKDLLPRGDGEACNPTVGVFVANEETPDDFEFVARTNVVGEAMEATFEKSVSIKNRPGNRVRMSLFDMYDDPQYELIATYEATVAEILEKIQAAGGGLFYEGDQPTIENIMAIEDDFQFIGNKKFPIGLGLTLKTKAMRKKMRKQKKEKSKRVALKKENKALREQLAQLEAKLGGK